MARQVELNLELKRLEAEQAAALAKTVKNEDPMKKLTATDPETSPPTSSPRTSSG